MLKTRTILATVCFFGLAMMMTACAGFGGAGTNTSSTATSTSKTTGTSSTNGSTPGGSTGPTYGSSTPPISIPTNFQTFTTPTFAIDYPVGWKESNGSDKRNYSFMRSDGVTGLFVGVNDTDTNPTDTLTHFDGSILSCTQDKTTKTATFGGTTWTQSTSSCNLASATLVLTTLNGYSPAKVPFVIAYEAYDTVAAPTLVNAAQATSIYFQPMLQSFQFK